MVASDVPQLVSLAFSMVSLSFACASKFFVTRTPGLDDPDPSVLWALPPVFLLYSLVVSINVTSLALVLVYARMWGPVLVFCCLAYSLVGSYLLGRGRQIRFTSALNRILLYSFFTNKTHIFFSWRVVL